MTQRVLLVEDDASLGRQVTDRLRAAGFEPTWVRDGQAQSKGVDQFTLVRESGAWRIAVVAYTSMPAR